MKNKTNFSLLLLIIFFGCEKENTIGEGELNSGDSVSINDEIEPKYTEVGLIHAWESPFNLTDSDTPSDVVTKLQQAINSASANNERLIVQKGFYTINDQITFPTDIDIDFSGAEFKRESGTSNGDIFDMFTNDDHFNGNTNINIRNLTIDGNKDIDNLTPIDPTHRFSGLKLSKVSDSRLENITVNNTTNGEHRDGVQAENPASGVFFTNNCVNINCYQLDAFNNDFTGITIYKSEKIRIFGSITSNNGGSGIGSKDSDFCEFYNIISFDNGFTTFLATPNFSNISVNGENCKVNNVTTYNSTGSGLNIGHEDSESKSDFTIVDNVESYENELEGISIMYSKHLLISNINLHNNKRNNLRIFESSSKVQINNAIIWGYYNKNGEVSGGNGIEILSGGGHNINNVVIYDNFTNGIKVKNVTGGVSIGSEVFIYNNGRKDEFSAPNGDPNHKSSGILLYNSNLCFINGPKIFSDEASGQKSQDYGIHIDGGNQHNIIYPEIWGNALNDIEICCGAGNDIQIVTFN